jgi:hypothetical protein
MLWTAERIAITNGICSCGAKKYMDMQLQKSFLQLVGLQLRT